MYKLKNSKIVVIDDTKENIDILIESLIDKYEIYAALNGFDGIELVKEILPDLILLDIMMPEMDGYETIQKLKSDRNTKNIPVIFVSALSEIENKKRGFELGAVDYITKPFEIIEVEERVKIHLKLVQASRLLINQNKILDERVKIRTQENENLRDAMIMVLASVAETRDPDTGAHIKRTQHYVKALAIGLSKNEKYRDILDAEYIEFLFKTSPLHDLGKVGIKDEILLKPGKLTDLEFEIMKTHAELGYQSLKKAEACVIDKKFIELADEIARTHHEKWDGTGYPRGLKKEEIPLSGRIMALADVYDALISKRVYKDAFSHKEAKEIIVENSGTHFDPDLVEVFLEIEEELQEIASRFKD